MCIARAVLLVGAEHAALGAAFDELGPRLDRQFGQHLHLNAIGDPRHSGPEFRKALGDLTVANDAWAAQLATYGESGVAIRFTTDEVADSMGFAWADLPCILFQPWSHDEQPILVRIPASLAEHEVPARKVVDAVLGVFSRTVLEGIAARSLDERTKALTRVVEALRRQLHGIAGVSPDPRRGGRPQINPVQDQRIAEAWATKHYANKSDLARELGLPVKVVKSALERARKK